MDMRLHSREDIFGDIVRSDGCNKGAWMLTLNKVAKCSMQQIDGRGNKCSLCLQQQNSGIQFFLFFFCWALRDLTTVVQSFLLMFLCSPVISHINMMQKVCKITFMVTDKNENKPFPLLFILPPVSSPHLLGSVVWKEGLHIQAHWDKRIAINSNNPLRQPSGQDATIHFKAPSQT